MGIYIWRASALYRPFIEDSGRAPIADLEEEISSIASPLRELNDLRVRSAKLRDEGIAHVRTLLLERRSAPAEYEDALLVRALCHTAPPPSEDDVARLERVRLEDFNKKPTDVITAALFMQALTAAPSSAFSRVVLVSYYWIIRELYTADAPDWSTGGARVGRSALVSAFATGECVRALLGFRRAQENTAEFVRWIAWAIARFEAMKSQEIPECWRKAETKRISLSLLITLKRLSGNLAILIALPDDPRDIPEFVARASELLEVAIRSARASFVKALDEVTAYREQVEGKVNEAPAKLRFERSESGHSLARRAVERAIKNAESALGLFDAQPFDKWDSLESAFRAAAREVTGLLPPACAYLGGVLDHELAASVSGGDRPLDAAALACAAASYGAASGHWDDERMMTAIKHLTDALSGEGMFPKGRPVFVEGGVSSWPGQAAQTGALAQLLQHVIAVDVSPRTAARMLRFFVATRVFGEGDSSSGWRYEYAPDVSKSAVGTTAAAVLALDRINRMLDAQINRRVLRHFTVTQPEAPTLNDLFYPDFGLLAAPSSIAREESVAISLERIRAHITGVRLSPLGWEPLQSLVLHGPPGTGKTTLLAALASSCRVPLVEVTPSDIVIRGEDSIEGRTRAVFEALSLLTRVVIILDEFDPVLVRREGSGRPRTPTVFSFLTPGMLPKLKALNDCARRRGVGYALVTNLVGTLDRAAIREGRFDLHVGIYPPDPVSRAGRLMLELAAAGKHSLRMDRVITAVKCTGGGSMQALGREGWFTNPRKEIRKRSVFDFVLRNGEEPPWPEPESDPPTMNGSETSAALEYKQWKWVRDWDSVSQSAVDLKGVFDLRPDCVAVVPTSRLLKKPFSGRS